MTDKTARTCGAHRLRLRALGVPDAPFVAALYGDARVTQTLLRIQAPLSLEQARRFCARGEGHGSYRFVATLRSDGERVALGTVHGDARRPEAASIGYSVLPAFWGRGLGTELARLLVDFAGHSLGAREILATTLSDNRASARILERLGFAIRDAEATEIDSRGDTRRVTRWALEN